jgi:hypothetical protein
VVHNSVRGSCSQRVLAESLTKTIDTGVRRSTALVDDGVYSHWRYEQESSSTEAKKIVEAEGYPASLTETGALCYFTTSNYLLKEAIPFSSSNITEEEDL